jgi:ABC-type cobalamin/Fe3+-siderophores transport system ATPase subunit
MLKVENLNQYYGGSHILRDLSFEAPTGQVTCLLGRNGVGKTTLLKTLMGLVPAKTGTVTFDGNDHHRRTVACAGQGRHRLRAAGARDLPAPDRRGKPAAWGWRRNPAARRFRTASSRCSRC